MNYLNKSVRLICVLCFACSIPLIARAQQRPLITEDVDIIPPGSLRIGVGIDFVQGAKFPLSGLTGDLTRAGVISVSIGLAPNVEVQVEGVAQNFLAINSRGPSAIALQLAQANSTNGVGDFTLATKIKLRSETLHGPSLGFRFGVELPNSNQSRGIGLNQTNAFGQILIGKRFGHLGRVNTFGNVGLAILTAPTALFTQNDVVTYGFAGIVFAPRVCVLILRGLRGSPNSARDRELLSESLTILLLSLRPPNNSGILRTTKRRAGGNFGRRIFSALPIGHDHLVLLCSIGSGDFEVGWEVS